MSKRQTTPKAAAQARGTSSGELIPEVEIVEIVKACEVNALLAATLRNKLAEAQISTAPSIMLKTIERVGEGLEGTLAIIVGKEQAAKCREEALEIVNVGEEVERFYKPINKLEC